jgi:thioredoxin reductase (NADPH)
VVEEVLAGDDGKMRAVLLRSSDGGETRELAASGLFVAIGHDPTTALFLDQLDHDDAGYLVTRPGTTETNVPGVFAAGDVRSGSTKRVASAVGEGAMAVRLVHEHLAHVG